MPTGAVATPGVFRRWLDRLHDRSFFLQTAARFEGSPQYYNAIEILTQDLAISSTVGSLPGHLVGRFGFAFRLMLDEMQLLMPTLEPGMLDAFLEPYAEIPRDERTTALNRLWRNQLARLDREFPGLVGEIDDELHIQTAARYNAIAPDEAQLVYATLAVYFALYFRARDEVDGVVHRLLR